MAKFTTRCFTNAKPLSLPVDANPAWSAVDVEFNTANYSPGATDYIQLCTLPEGYRVLDWALVFPDIDTNATPTIQWSLGISNSTLALPVSTDIGTGLQVWGASLNAGRDNAIVRAGNSNAAQSTGRPTALLSGDREIVLRCTTAAATYDGATRVGRVLLLIEG
jgi:hypothetical protein